jgi:hypothetical protein
MNPHDIRIEASLAARLRDQMEAYGDEDLTLDMIEGETRLIDMIDALMSARAEDAAMAQALKAHQDDLAARKKRFEARADARKKLAQIALTEAGIRKLERPAYTASLSATPASVVITDDSALPDELCRIKREPDKTAIKKALQAGDEVRGASLSNGGETLTIRVK